MLRKRSGVVATLWLFLIASCLRTTPTASLRPSQPPTAENRQTAPLPPVPPHRFTRGEVLYLRHCADCHGWEGRGDGPLAQILAKKPQNLRQHAEKLRQYTDTDLAARILQGQPLPLLADVPVPPYTEREVRALLSYLQQLPTLPWTEVRSGQKAYDSLCTACHGLYGRGDGLRARSLTVALPDLSESTAHTRHSDTELFQIIADGRGSMPGAGDVLTPHEIRAVIRFLHVLSPGYELYGRYCAYCHGPEGRPVVSLHQGSSPLPDQHALPTFDQVYFQTHSVEELRSAIQHMRRELRPAMPHFAAQLGSDEVFEIIAHLRTFSSAP